MIDFELGRFTRRCAATERELLPGEQYHSALFEEGGEVVRRDYSCEAWKDPPEEAFSWWQSQIPAAEAKPTLAPREVILQYFEQLENQPDKADMRFVVGLLMVRKRIVRLEESETDEQGHEVMVLVCNDSETEYRTPAVQPTAERVLEIQEELGKLLYSDS